MRFNKCWLSIAAADDDDVVVDAMASPTEDGSDWVCG